MGGNHARIEGAYVLYSPQSQYYYLFCSFGGLDAAGGYNIRVSRSRSPDGPYVDGAGTDMATVKGAAGPTGPAAQCFHSMRPDEGGLASAVS